jgi:hypothetical protein
MNANSVGTVSGNRPRMFKVLCPVERKDGGTFWMRVGSAFPNKDQSINLYLDALPLGHNKLQIREMEDEDFNRGKRRDGDAAPPSSQAHGAGNDDLPF